MNDWNEETYRTKERLLENELGDNSRKFVFKEERVNGVTLYMTKQGQIRHRG